MELVDSTLQVQRRSKWCQIFCVCDCVKSARFSSLLFAFTFIERSVFRIARSLHDCDVGCGSCRFSNFEAIVARNERTEAIKESKQPGPESAKSGNRTRVAQSRPSFSPFRSRSTKRQLISPGHTPGPVVISNSRARIGSPPRLHRASLARNEPPNGKLVEPLHQLKLRFQPIQLPIIRRHYQLYRPPYGQLH